MKNRDLKGCRAAINLNKSIKYLFSSQERDDNLLPQLAIFLEDFQYPFPIQTLFTKHKKWYKTSTTSKNVYTLNTSAKYKNPEWESLEQLNREVIASSLQQDGQLFLIYRPVDASACV